MSEIVDPMNTIAQSSRVRLARNYADIPFPQRMQPGDYERIVERTENAVRFCVNGHRVTVRADAEIRWIEGYEHDCIFNPAGGFCCLPLAVDVTEGRRVAVELRVE